MVGTENHLGDGDVGGAKIHSFRSSESKAKGALYLHYEGTFTTYLNIEPCMRLQIQSKCTSKFGDASPHHLKHWALQKPSNNIRQILSL